MSMNKIIQRYHWAIACINSVFYIIGFSIGTGMKKMFRSGESNLHLPKEEF